MVASHEQIKTCRDEAAIVLTIPVVRVKIAAPFPSALRGRSIYRRQGKSREIANTAEIRVTEGGAVHTKFIAPGCGSSLSDDRPCGTTP
jgi:hypothetical protein